MSAPQTWGPDEWIDPWAPVDRLHQMPILAAQARELGQTRNPDGDRRSHVHAAPGSRPAARLDLIDVADDTTEARGSLRWLVLFVSRPIWVAVDPETRAAHPQPLGTPTWETECSWLAGIWRESRAWLDEVEMDMVDMTLDDCYRDLASRVGLRRPPVHHCDRCGEKLEPVGDRRNPDYWECPGCMRTFNFGLLIEQHLESLPVPMTLAAIARHIGRPKEAVKKWAQRGLIAPVKSKARRKLYDLHDAERIKERIAA